MKKFIIYHSNELVNPFLDNFPKWPDDYKKVAEVNTSDIDKAWLLANNIETSWVTNKEVTTDLEACRSTSIGDIIVDEDNKVLRCEIVGWKEIK